LPPAPPVVCKKIADAGPPLIDEASVIVIVDEPAPLPPVGFPGAPDGAVVTIEIGAAGGGAATAGDARA
jgi:hypothetical protein